MSTIKKTYLRYECADACGITCDATALTNQIISHVGCGASNNDGLRSVAPPIVLCAGKSQCIAYHMRRGIPCAKLSHREPINIGTGRSLNSNEISCLDTISVQAGGIHKNASTITTSSSSSMMEHVATGWIDGSIRIFQVSLQQLQKASSTLNPSDSTYNLGMVHSLLHPKAMVNDDFLIGGCGDPLVLQGHGSKPVRYVTFDRGSGGAGCGMRIASGGSDGTVIVWDLITETGLFRLLGHKGAITHLSFISPTGTFDEEEQQQQQPPSSLSTFDGLVSAGLDGLVKIWDLTAQCCIQTIASHRSEVWAADCIVIPPPSRNGDDEEDDAQSSKQQPQHARYRLVTISSDIQLRVWGLYQPKRTLTSSSTQEQNEEKKDEAGSVNDSTNVAIYMGSLHRQTNERGGYIKFHSNGQVLGVMAHHSKCVEIYRIRSMEESLKKRKRRHMRRREKETKQKNKQPTSNMDNDNKKSIKRGGILDDDDEENDNDIEMEHDGDNNKQTLSLVDPNHVMASDEMEFVCLVRSHHKIKSFVFSPSGNSGVVRLILALSTNALETHMIQLDPSKTKPDVPPTKLVSMYEMYGHPTGIRSLIFSSDDTKCCSISKGCMKLWNIFQRTCIRSFPLTTVRNIGIGDDDEEVEEQETNNNTSSLYGLCCVFLPGNLHVLVGSREGHLQIIDYASGNVVYSLNKAHEGAIWSLDLRCDGEVVMTGSADRTVKFWSIELNTQTHKPCLVQERTLQMKDDVICVKYSYHRDPHKRLICVATLDCTIKVFFDDSLKFFLSLYGHKLPVLAMDCTDDGSMLASGGADKSIKLWGLDFGDTHRTLYGHEDSITDLKFLKGTHSFFTSSKDKTMRYWDGDRFELILILRGHSSEINSISISQTGAFVWTGGMDRQIRIWERTKDIVFVEEERERELEQLFDSVDGAKGSGQRSINMTGNADAEDDEIDGGTSGKDMVQSEAAVKKSVISVAAGDRLVEALELADEERKKQLVLLKKHKTNSATTTTNNPLLMGMEPPAYVLWVLRTIKSSELEQALLILPMNHMERLMYYMILLLRKGLGVELCSKVSVFLIKIHQHQIIANHTIAEPLKELRRLIKSRIGYERDLVGYNMAGFRTVARLQSEFETNKHSFTSDDNGNDIWAHLGLGSDVAAALTTKSNKKRKT